MKTVSSCKYHVIISDCGYQSSWLISSSLELAEREASRISSSYPVGSVFVVEVIETREVVFKTW